MPGIVKQVLRYDHTGDAGPDEVLLILEDGENLLIQADFPHYPSVTWVVAERSPMPTSLKERLGTRSEGCRGTGAFISGEVAIGDPLWVRTYWWVGGKSDDEPLNLGRVTAIHTLGRPE